MSETISYRGALTLIGLQTKIRNDEALGLTLNKIEADGSDTVGIYEEGSVPKRSLRLLLDPAGNLPPPDSTTLVCRGEAMIQANKQKVAAFRINSP